MNLPNAADPVIIAVDLQERLMPSVYNTDEVTARAKVLLAGAAEIGVPVIATEQYPKGLGNTVPEIAELLPRKRTQSLPKPLFPFSAKKTSKTPSASFIPTP
jgi:nicotinamidase-related amidase